MKKLSAIPCSIVLLWTLLFGAVMAGPATAAPRMPEFILKSVVDGQDIDSRSFAGKVLLITFFATWCPPCIEEIPTLIELQKAYAENGFSIVGLSVDQGGPEEVAQLVSKHKINYPVMLADNETMENFGGVYGIPVSFLVNGEGNVVKKYPGFVPKSILQKDIQSVMN